MYEPVAIVGTSCRFPAPPSKLWDLLKAPRDVLREFPPERLNMANFHHENGETHGRTNVEHKSYLLEEDVRHFDAAFFRTELPSRPLPTSRTLFRSSRTRSTLSTPPADQDCQWYSSVRANTSLLSSPFESGLEAQYWLQNGCGADALQRRPVLPRGVRAGLRVRRCFPGPDVAPPVLGSRQGGRLLDISAGTRNTTSAILGAVGDAHGHYTCAGATDTIVEKVKEELVSSLKSETTDNVSFRALNVDGQKDWASQGFEAGSYDIVVATDVLRASQDLSTAMRNVRGLLRPGGSEPWWTGVRGSSSPAIATGEWDEPPQQHLSFTRSERLSYAQAGFYYLTAVSDNPASFNLTARVSIRGRLDAERFSRAFDKAMQHHDALRTCFLANGSDSGNGGSNQVMQHLAKKAATRLGRLQSTQETAEADYKKAFDKIAENKYSLATGDTLQATLVRHGAQWHTLIMGFHNIALDAVSIKFFLDGIDRSYRSQPLTRDAASYLDFTRQQFDDVEAGRLDQGLRQAVTAARGADIEHAWPQTLPERFEQVVASFPDSVAIQEGDEAITYRELQRLVESYARVLLPEARNRIAVLCEPGVELCATMLTIFHVGAVFVPLDVSLPAARRNDILKVCQPDLLVYQAATATSATEDHGSYRSLNLPEAARAAKYASHASPAPPKRIATDQGSDSYILFTSGSTGVPKGIKLRQRVMMNYAAHASKAYGLGQVRVLQQTSIGFDLFFAQVYNAFTNGGTLVVAPVAARGDPDALSKLMLEQRVELTLGVPSEYRLLLNYAPDVLRQCRAWRFCHVGGEPLPQQLIKDLRDLQLPSLTLTNVYGPAEAFIVTHRDIQLGDAVQGQKEEESGYYVGGTPGDYNNVGYVLPNLSIYIAGSGVPQRLAEHGQLAALLPRLRLPQYMITAAIVPLERLPVSPNGKLDTGALERLPLPESSTAAPAQRQTGDDETGATETEAVLRSIWIDVIGPVARAIRQIGPDASFFSVGGISLLLVQLQHAIHRKFDVKIHLRRLREIPDLRALAAVLRKE
ncbi:polyketide synthetase [Apiospora saccharicola]|uniref:Polyketide synthetase n=1 Tax=Apiospora saccharicola TaxID=335842 RepID=A0ABR1WFD6_9PEZI